MANPTLKVSAPNPNDDLWRRPLNEVKHQTLTIWSREDRVLTFDNGLVLMKSLPNAAVARVAEHRPLGAVGARQSVQCDGERLSRSWVTTAKSWRPDDTGRAPLLNASVLQKI